MLNRNTQPRRVIADYPGYAITEPTKTILDADNDVEVPWFVDGEQFAIAFQSRNHGTLYRFYTLGSVVSYAMRYGECPVEALDRARERGHKLHWANLNATSISAYRSPTKPDYPLLKEGDTIRFEGRMFTLKANREHIELVEV